ncbi:MAG: nuclear transport factor 2 family protein [Scytonematopsis contorta HA4267-MV1]|nr:nuclear transport factor 2 family protein [Scytonematopsis contorta HA4267-MV1]
MSQDAVLVVKKYYDALAKGDMEQLLAVAAADIILEEASSLPYAGIYQGHQGWMEFGAAFNTVWQDAAITVDSINDAGHYVIGLARLSAKSRSTLKSIEMPLAELFWVVDGKIKRLIPFYWDTAAVLKVLE